MCDKGEGQAGMLNYCHNKYLATTSKIEINTQKYNFCILYVESNFQAKIQSKERLLIEMRFSGE